MKLTKIWKKKPKTISDNGGPTYIASREKDRTFKIEVGFEPYFYVVVGTVIGVWMWSLW